MTGPAALLIARHGEAWCNLRQIVGGPRGCRGLTDNGRAQVQCLADRLRREHQRRPIDALYATPLPRVRESAAIVSEALGIEPIIEPDLREADYGEADGKPWVEVVSAFAGIPAREPDRPIAVGAEPWTSYLHRSSSALRDLLERHIGQQVLVVGHGETVATTAHLFLNLPADARASVEFAAYPASLTTWEQTPVSWTNPGAGSRWTLVRLNDTSHATP